MSSEDIVGLPQPEEDNESAVKKADPAHSEVKIDLAQEKKEEITDPMKDLTMKEIISGIKDARFELFQDANPGCVKTDKRTAF
jgi:hypothetical protein